MTREDSAGWRRATAAVTLALALFCILWEVWLAPLRPSGSWLALKAVPLLLLIPGIARGEVKATQWLLLVLPLYLGEGLVRSFSETGRHAACAYLEVALTACALVSGVRYVKARAAAG